MRDEELKQAIAELQEVVRCRCHEAYRDRGLKDPHCECDSAEAVKIVADRIEALTKERDQHWDSFVHWRKEADDRSEQLAAARRDAEIAEEELELQEEEACMMENSYFELEKELNTCRMAQAVMDNTVADLEAKLEELRQALLWCSGSADFNEGGVAREGWLKVCAPLLKGDDHD